MIITELQPIFLCRTSLWTLNINLKHALLVSIFCQNEFCTSKVFFAILKPSSSANIPSHFPLLKTLKVFNFPYCPQNINHDKIVINGPKINSLVFKTKSKVNNYCNFVVLPPHLSKKVVRYTIKPYTSCISVKNSLEHTGGIAKKALW